MNDRDQLALLVLACVVLQLGSLALLPKRWKIAACPPLLLLLLMVLDLTSGGNLAGLMTCMTLAPLTILWLLAVLGLFGISRVTRKSSQDPDSSDPPA